MRFPLCLIGGVLLAAWIVGLAFHFYPAPMGMEWTWWSLPWTYTVVLVGGIVPIASAWHIGAWWEDRE